MILIIEDDEKLSKNLKRLLTPKYKVDIAADLDKAYHLLIQKNYNIVISDFKIKDRTAFEFIDKVQKYEHKPLFIIITAYPNWEIAIEAMKKGVYDFLAKPFEFYQLEAIIKRAYEFIKIKNENIALKRFEQEKIIGESEHIKKVLELTEKIAKTDTTVLITGETGTGKELVARRIHNLSNRKDNPFIVINCGAIPENLIETELFGYTEGAFTGAVGSKAGAIELAEKGTLFLDEIGEMPYHLQVKLLRILEGHSFRRVGGEQEIQPDVRIIAATNKNLEELIKQNKFRQDLFYRLNVFTINLLPLRERKEDILPIVNYYIDYFNKKFNKKIEGITEEIKEELLSYNWAGNIRELINTIERAILLTDENANYITNISLKRDNHLEYKKIKLEEHLQNIEKEIIEKYLKYCNNNIEQAAELLNISETKLIKKIEKFKIK
ncbi:MAG TPA: sigma-54 dependent transcriptional regulator [bacterium]|nr:sigma-54 dependent transcriptional regulator [bacterium]HOL46731.1 sigma-54 dependent transcriptional regulator [bacterium]HPQ18167.1 sigma-54 dependent transcriptional regulator [bacterium]